MFIHIIALAENSDVLLKKLNDKKLSNQISGALGLLRMGPKGIDELYKVINRRNYRIKCHILSKAYKKKIPRLFIALLCLKFIKDKNCFVRSDSVYFLGKLQIVSQKIRSTLIAALKDQDINVRITAAQALSKIAPKFKNKIDIINALAEMSTSTRIAGVSVSASRALAKICSVEELFDMLKSNNFRRKIASSNSLPYVDSVPMKLIPRLIRFLNCGDDIERTAAIQVLKNLKFPPKIVLSALTKALQDKDPSVRMYAVESLCCHPKYAKSVIRKILPLLYDKDRNVKNSVIRLLIHTNSAKISDFSLSIFLQEYLILESENHFLKSELKRKHSEKYIPIWKD